MTRALIRVELVHIVTRKTTILFVHALKDLQEIHLINAHKVKKCHPRYVIQLVIISYFAVQESPTITERPPSCIPSPCGPNAQCQMVGNRPACSCLPDFIGQPPHCRPECVLNQECAAQQACIQQKCRDPCPGSCGFEANCHVLNHVPICTCNAGLSGDPFVQCSPIATMIPIINEDPCNPSPCGPNAECSNGNCACISEYQGNPYEGCRPECSTNADCNRNKACLRSKCVDPCIGTCGQNAQCEIVNHIPICSCPNGYTGDPFSFCRVEEQKTIAKIDPCHPSPCGANSQCRQTEDHGVCTCLQGFIGDPPHCRPECVVSSECSPTQACVNQKCVDPCRGACGINARCEVFNHSPICSCNPGETGDPFKSCQIVLREDIPVETQKNPCVPSPCGPNSICQAHGVTPSCQCVSGYIGSPPHCKPECIINTDCPARLTCINNKCQDPCNPGPCGTNAECHIVAHTVSCTCPERYNGNPFVQCIPYGPNGINISKNYFTQKPQICLLFLS